MKVSLLRMFIWTNVCRLHLSSLSSGQGDLLWLGTLPVTLLLYCLWSSGKPVGASSSGQGEGVVSTSVATWDCVVWLLGTVWCSCLLVPPPWSAGWSYLSFCGSCGVWCVGLPSEAVQSALRAESVHQNCITGRCANLHICILLLSIALYKSLYCF